MHGALASLIVNAHSTLRSMQVFLAVLTGLILTLILVAKSKIVPGILPLEFRIVPSFAIRHQYLLKKAVRKAKNSPRSHPLAGFSLTFVWSYLRSYATGCGGEST